MKVKGPQRNSSVQISAFFLIDTGGLFHNATSANMLIIDDCRRGVYTKDAEMVTSEAESVLWM